MNDELLRIVEELKRVKERLTLLERLERPKVLWKTWAPTYSATGAMTFTAVTTTRARYFVLDDVCYIQLKCQGTTGGTAGRGLIATLPVDAANVNQSLGGYVVDGSSTTHAGGIVRLESVTTLGAFRYDYANFGLGTVRQINAFGFYEI